MNQTLSIEIVMNICTFKASHPVHMKKMGCLSRGGREPLPTLPFGRLSSINWFSAINLSQVPVLCLWPPHQVGLIERSSDNEPV